MLRTSILAVAALLVFAPAAGAATLDQTVEAWLAGSQVSGSHTSLMVLDRTTGRLLVVHDATTELRPASNMKLLTSAAVLERFGVGSHLTTRVMTGGTLAGGTLTGNLWLVGGGDPSLATNTFSINSWAGVSGRLADLAIAVHAAGIRRVTGRFYGDESRFDRVRSGPFWKAPWWRDCPPLTALSVNEDLFAFGQPQASPDPPLFAAQHFVSSLRAQGTVFRVGPSTGTHPATARVVASEASPALTRLVRQMDQRSDNYYAEVLAKNLAVHGGLAGTTANGVRGIRNAVGDMGVVLSGARVRRIGALARGPSVVQGHHRGAQPRRGSAVELVFPLRAAPGRGQRHAAGSDDDRPGLSQRAGQDRHARRRLGALRLRHGGQRPPAAVLDGDEQPGDRRARGPPPAGPDLPAAGGVAAVVMSAQLLAAAARGRYRGSMIVAAPPAAAAPAPDAARASTTTTR
jgi:D-Ala-D-Ala carboxypeptidase 3 (S13) family